MASLEGTARKVCNLFLTLDVLYIEEMKPVGAWRGRRQMAFIGQMSYFILQIRLNPWEKPSMKHLCGFREKTRNGVLLIAASLSDGQTFSRSRERKS
jgi:hypothetical protein